MKKIKRIECHIKERDNRWILNRASKILSEIYEKKGDFDRGDLDEALDKAAEEKDILDKYENLRRAKYGYWVDGKFIRRTPFHIYGDDPVYTKEEIERMES